VYAEEWVCAAITELASRYWHGPRNDQHHDPYRSIRHIKKMDTGQALMLDAGKTDKGADPPAGLCRGHPGEGTVKIFCEHCTAEIGVDKFPLH